jgi:hypothetical protein
MSDTNDQSDTFEISRVFSRTTGAIGANPLLYFGLSLILGGIPGFLSGWWQFDLRASVDPQNPASVYANYFTRDFWLHAGAMWAVALICSAILQTALIRATATFLADRKPTFVLCLETGLAMILPVTALMLIMTIGLGIGFLLLIVPGVILWLYWSVVIPARVQERIGIFDAFRRSAELTEGNRGNIFLTFLVAWIAIFIFTWIVRLILGPMLATSSSQPMFSLVEALVAAITNMIVITLQASVYVEVRTLKDGVLPNALAEIFA